MDKITSDSTKMLEKEKISKLVLRFAGTTLAALLFNALYSLTDALFVSWGVGDDAMGGVSVVFPFVIIQGAISTALGSGAASIVSRKLGKKQCEKAGNVTFNAMITFYTTAIIITILGFIFMEPMLEVMGITKELYPHAKQYLTIILAGNVFSTGFSSIIRAEGKMTYGLLIWVIPISINIILDAVFVLALGMGVRGSALATVICQMVSFFMCILFFKYYTCQSFKNKKINKKTISSILAIGLPSLIQMASLSIITLLLNNVLGNNIGSLGIKSFAYISRILAFVILPFTALTQALSPIVGYSYGNDNKKRIVESIKFCIIISLAYSLVTLFLLQLIPQQLIRIFTQDSQIIMFGSSGLRIISVSLPFIPIPMLMGCIFQAMGKKTKAFIMYCVNLLFLIPAVMICSHFFETNGIWWAYVISNVLSTIIAMLFIYKENKNHYTI